MVLPAGGVAQAPSNVSVVGTVFDSLHGRPLPGAFVTVVGANKTAFTNDRGVFSVDGVAPGSYAITIEHEILDSIGLYTITSRMNIRGAADTARLATPSLATMWRSICPQQTPAADSGILVGTVRMSDGSAPHPGTSVEVSWLDLTPGRTSVDQQWWKLSTTADSAGRFALCGTPVSTALHLIARADSAGSAITQILPLGETRIARRDVHMVQFGSAVTGAVSGVVTTSAGVPLEGAIVSAETKAEVRTGADGSFAFAMLTAGTQRLDVRAPGYESTTITVDVVPADTSHVNVKMTGGNPATMTGTIIADPAGKPIADAEVSLLDLGLLAMSSTTGAYRINDIPPGPHHLRVRRIGYSVMDTTLAFGPAESVRRSIYLSPVTVLDSVHVTARMRDPGMDDFDENRRLGLGHFYTRADIAKFDNMRTADFLTQTSGITMVIGNTGKAWVASNGRVSHMNIAGTGGARMSPEDVRAGAKGGMCYATVYLDNAMVYSPKMSASLFDVNSISPSSIEAIEYYSGPGQIPQKYMRLDTACGVIVIHTRR
jgi:hypothetical protein